MAETEIIRFDERERWARIADELRDRCKTLCVSDHEHLDWHAGYQFALSEFARKLRADCRGRDHVAVAEEPES